MDIQLLPKGTIRIRGKTATLAVEPKETVSADATLILVKDRAFREVTDSRLTVLGAGEYEISGVKLTAFSYGKDLSFDIRIDGIELLLCKAETLSPSQAGSKDYDVVLTSVDDSVSPSVVTALSPRVVVLFGQNASAAARDLGKQPLVVKKFYATKEKLPAEMEVVVLG